ncbi:hypothetical protein [Nocardioides sp. B-3]|uniref:hypothetical protein n=1 Tax=Nocardioides sp. B-3 TaxID=2895565 RepID=UPI002152B08C|nr:hypothetical protein [Nocardioides sp. B-3]UUZ59987.1 hypothetical protein LP418_02920 [Nocardioides sp. B-3]
MLSAASSGAFLGADVNYWTSIFPFVMLMSLGMGAVFVPLTLTAVHHVRAEDSGIGSGVLNTMQQVGGALGLAIMSTIASSAATDHADKIAPGVAKGLAGAEPNVIRGLVQLGSFPTGATAAFFFGTFLMAAGSLIVWLFLNVKHEELATDGPAAVPGH